MSNKIKILYTIPNFDTAGSGRVVVDLVKGLDKSQFEPHICCTHNKGAYFKVVESLGVPIHIFPFYTSYRPLLTLLPRIWKIRRFFKKNKFDLIHSWHWSSDFTEALAAKWAGIPYIYTKKSMGWGNKAGHWKTQLSTQVIAINTAMVNGILKPYKKKVVYMPLGLDTEEFTLLKKKRTTPLGHKFREDDFIIVSVANLVPVKGIEILLEAVQELGDNRIKVLVVGNHQNKYGQKLVKTYQSPDIIFVDKQLDVKPYLAVADLFVICTKKMGEGLPVAPLEAMASGLLTLGSRVPGVEDILKEFPECLFEAENSEELKNKISYSINLTERERNNLRMKMMESVKERYAMSRFMEEHQVVYKKIVQ